MRRRIVLLEDRAHEQSGHFPNSAALLANALGTLGCDVTLLTARGWAAGAVADPRFRVERLRGISSVLWTIADVTVDRTRRWFPAGSNVAGMVASVIRECALVIGMQRRTADAEVISFSYAVRPAFVAAFGGKGRFVHYVLHLPPGGRAPATLAGRILDAAARARQGARRRAGGGMCLAVASAELRDAWTARTPYLDPVVIAHALSRDEAPVPDARAQLGIAADVRLALVFGAWHDDKDPTTVWQAFRELPEWTLLVVGSMAESYRGWARLHDGEQAIVIPGFVDEATRALVYSAADVVIVSFRDGFVRDSGVVRDAVTWACPVVCSSGNESAGAVARFGLGEVFAAGDPHDLAAAVTRVRDKIDPADLARARAEMSDVVMAQRYLDAFDAMAPTMDRGRAATTSQAGRK